jgi:hypothetical protein
VPGDRAHPVLATSIPGVVAAPPANASQTLGGGPGVDPGPPGGGGELAVGVPVVGGVASSLLVTDGSDTLQSGPLTSSVVSASSAGGIPAWAASTAYALNVLVSNSGANYICNTAHTSGSTFAAEAGDWTALGSGGDATVINGGSLGATATVALAGAANTMYLGTLTANCAITVTGLSAGCEALLLLQQNSTGGWTITINGSGVTIPTTASVVTNVSLWSPDGSTLYAQPGAAAGPAGTAVVATITQSATPSINTGVCNVASITGLAQAITSMTTNLTASPSNVDGQTLIVRLTDNGTGRAITWGSSFEASTVALPTTTVASTMLCVGFLWNVVTSKWRCVAVA